MIAISITAEAYWAIRATLPASELVAGPAGRSGQCPNLARSKASSTGWRGCAASTSRGASAVTGKMKTPAAANRSGRHDKSLVDLGQ